MRNAKPVNDARILEEIDALGKFLDARGAEDQVDRNLLQWALGAQKALQSVRDERQPDPMNPMRMISLLEIALDLRPRVVRLPVNPARKHK